MQLSRSSGSGLFAGGAQRTIEQAARARPRSAIRPSARTAHTRRRRRARLSENRPSRHRRTRPVDNEKRPKRKEAQRASLRRSEWALLLLGPLRCLTLGCLTLRGLLRRGRLLLRSLATSRLPLRCLLLGRH